MKKFYCRKRRFGLFCVMLLMFGLLGLPMSVRAEDTVLTYEIYHKHISGCIQTTYKTMEADDSIGPILTGEDTCGICGGIHHYYEYAPSCSCGRSWYGTGHACINSSYGGNMGNCPNYSPIRVNTIHEHPYMGYVCGMTEEDVIEVIQIHSSTLLPAQQVILTAETENMLDKVKLEWEGSDGASEITVSENGTYHLYATYTDGQIEYVTELEVAVDNIDRVAPAVGEIQASTTEYTKGKITLTIEAEDNVGLPENYVRWNGGAYGNSNRYEVSENGNYTVEIRDVAGNTVTRSVQINNIDREAPEVSEIKASTTRYTNGNIVLTVEAKDNTGLPEKYACWNNGEYTASNQYVVSENGTYMVMVRDIVGNTTTRTIQISNIDREAPTAGEIQANTTEYTNCDVILSVEVRDNTDLPEKYISWNGEEFSGNNQYEVSENGIYNVEVKDAAGNTVKKTIEINNIDKNLPEIISVTGTPMPWYDGVCVVTVEATDGSADDAESGLASEAYSWDGGQTWTAENTYEQKESGVITVQVRDHAGNIAQAEVEIVKEKRPTTPEKPTTNGTQEGESKGSEILSETSTEKTVYSEEVNDMRETKPQELSGNVKEESLDDFFLPKEENVIESEPFYEMAEPLETDMLEKDERGNHKIAVICLIGAGILGMLLLLPILYVLCGMCRVYEVNSSNDESYLGRVGMRYSNNKYEISIGNRMIDKASERHLKIKIPGWFVKINSNRPLTIEVGEMVIEKYIEKEVQFYIQV